jgi:hypothetical protein
MTPLPLHPRPDASADRSSGADAAAWDRYLDGESAADEAEALERALAANPAVRARLEARRRFHGALASARQADRPAPEAVAALTSRVRAGLAADRPAGAGRLRLVRTRVGVGIAAAAAVVLVALGLGPLGVDVRSTEATPRAALIAADMLRTPPSPPTPDTWTCAAQEPTSPYLFPPVRDRELAVRGCREEEVDETRAMLYRQGELPAAAFVAVPASGSGEGSEIGVLDLGDAIVFDVNHAGTAYYLAVPREFFDRMGSCAACHGPARAAEANPHYFEKRRAPVSR